MKGKILFVTGAAIGYVLGARAGRKRYEQIAAAASKVWQTPGVQKQVHQVQDFAADKVGDIPDALIEGAKKVVSSVIKRPSSRTSAASTASSTKSTAGSTKPVASKASSTKASTANSSTAKSGAAKSTTAKSTTAKKPAAKSTTKKSAASRSVNANDAE